MAVDGILLGKNSNNNSKVELVNESTQWFTIPLDIKESEWYEAISIEPLYSGSVFGTYDYNKKSYWIGNGQVWARIRRVGGVWIYEDLTSKTYMPSPTSIQFYTTNKYPNFSVYKFSF